MTTCGDWCLVTVTVSLAMLCWSLLLLPHLLTVAGHQVRYCDRVYDTLNRSPDIISTISTYLLNI